VGDAAEIDLAEGSFDIVYQSTVFTSILDNGFQQKLADRMWALDKLYSFPLKAPLGKKYFWHWSGRAVHTDGHGKAN